jgi:hypothetical protein
LCDSTIVEGAEGALEFQFRERIEVKGRTEPVDVYHPYPLDGSEAPPTREKYAKAYQDQIAFYKDWCSQPVENPSIVR